MLTTESLSKIENNHPEKQSDRTSLQDDSSDSNDSNLKKFALFSVIIGDLLGFTGAGIGLGYLAWSKWHAPWWVMFLSTTVGLVLAFYRLYQITRKEL